jgi:RNA polymerase sigma factor (sigma-70 family)
MVMAPSETHRTITAVWRMESARLIAVLTRLVRDVGLAEELAQDALVAALEQWPESGVPNKPAAWLMATARHRAIDSIRRDRRLQSLDALGEPPQDGRTAADWDEQLDNDIGDDLLRLLFTACHPCLPREGRIALTLRLLCGLSTETIARAFLVPEPTIAQRIVRAKRKLSDEQVSLDTPAGLERRERLASVLECIYLVFNEGYTATTGPHWTRPELCEEAQRLVRILAELEPNEPEVHGLAALLELQASRLAARVTAQGVPILLLEQNRARWDPLLIRRGLAALERAKTLAERPGPYQLQAEIAACHARARSADETDWRRIAILYAQLLQQVPSPVIELNRAVAVGYAVGPEYGLAIVDSLVSSGTLDRYHLLASVRGDLLAKLARWDEARREFERAALLTTNAREREMMLARARDCKSREPSGECEI